MCDVFVKIRSNVFIILTKYHHIKHQALDRDRLSLNAPFYSAAMFSTSSNFEADPDISTSSQGTSQGLHVYPTMYFLLLKHKNIDESVFLK